MTAEENKDFAGATPETLARALVRQVPVKEEPAKVSSLPSTQTLPPETDDDEDQEETD